MTIEIALLRAINLGPHGKVAMADLKAMMAALGFEARSLLQSGNLVFDGGRSGTAKLETLLGQEVAKRLKLKTDFFVRTASEWDAVIRANPFPQEAKDDPSHLVVYTLKDAATASNEMKL